ncbi:uncharacterized protein Z518_05702 [Rhinocladiella mackenziei CBS 650.93]|uniref:Major facilitator superfamily (MFS) profile domain-containing protein n=1 Tax=Rhinocladiella mackenziei CBS 650.93 TaxID=1442369 RepID=A0A0D2INX0_9EURO|nr:uncharacterized protein Z518_05702 [Rhinocladiella mackenziei CBS 650.93]KIX04831.1 hypothetical protein Z518_05702 [Rhinocladiella mackenziei CBS 650.93]
MLTLIEPLASSVFAPGVPELMQNFDSTNTELSAFVVSVYVLGFAFGPMALAPMSEMWGRVPVYHTTNFIFLTFTVACAKAPSLDSLIVFRFFAGTFGAAPMTNGGGSIADMFPAEERAGIMAIFTVGPLIGPIIDPVIGGFLADAEGWRWDFWLIVIVAGAISLTMLLTLKESYSPVILERKVKRIRKETGDDRWYSKTDTGLSLKELFKKSIVRPINLLVFSPICTIFAFYLALVYGYIFHYMVAIIGLGFIGVGMCTLTFMWCSLTKAENSLCNLISFMAICTYLVDAYELYAASALAANIILRSIAGAFLSLCGRKMYNAMGLGWGNTLLGFIAVALIPIPFLLLRYGEILRKKFEIGKL